MSRHASPFHCPYCGEQDLWPHESAEGRGGWECRGCLRAFAVQMLGMVPPGGTPSSPESSSAPAGADR